MFRTSSGVFHCMHCNSMSYRFADSCSQAVSSIFYVYETQCTASLIDQYIVQQYAN